MRFWPSFSRRNTEDRALAQAIRNIFGYRPGNISLYQLAFRHRSVATPLTNGFKQSNERLEYLGDAVLGSVVADFLFKKFPFRDEGFLTEIRSRIVSRSNLNMLSRKLGLDTLVQTNRENNLSSSSILGDAFEAFVGALYLDKGYTFARRIIIHKIIQIHLDLDNLLAKETNFKSKIIEWAQKEKKTFEFKLAEEIDLGRKGRIYEVHLIIGEQKLAEASDFSIKKAEQKAAAKAWELLEENQE